MVTRADLQNKIKDLKIDIRAKTYGISNSKKKARFRGLTLKKQFDLGSSKKAHKTFRKRRKRERREHLGDVGLFTSQRQTLRNNLIAAEDDLFVFDNILLAEGKI